MIENDENVQNCGNLPMEVDPQATPKVSMAMRLSFSSEISEDAISESSMKDRVGNVQVYLRLKPRPRRIITRTKTNVIDDGIDTLRPIDNSTIEVSAPKCSNAFRNFDSNTKHTYTFSKVFDQESSQKTVFDECCESLVKGLLKGQDGLLFAYGVTNAGKTYTVEGTRKDPGLLPRAFEKLFELCEEKSDLVVKVSYLQIYNEEVHDLQVLNGTTKRALDKAKIKLRVIKNRVVAQGLTLTTIDSAEEGLKVLKKGRRQRTTHETDLNLTSSRSHSVFGIHLINNQTGKDSKLSIVDLAGSERNKRTKSTDQRQKEANHINTSLMRLNMCLKALKTNQQNKTLNPVHFRYSKLTHLLRDNFLKPNSAGVVMIVNCSTLNSDFDETVHTLNYGTEASKVKLIQKKDNKRLLLDHTVTYDNNGRPVYSQRKKKAKIDRISLAPISMPENVVDLELPSKGLENQIERVDFDDMLKKPGNVFSKETKSVVEALLEDANERFEEEKQRMIEYYEKIVRREQITSSFSQTSTSGINNNRIEDVDEFNKASLDYVLVTKLKQENQIKGIKILEESAIVLEKENKLLTEENKALKVKFNEMKEKSMEILKHLEYKAEVVKLKSTINELEERNTTVLEDLEKLRIHVKQVEAENKILKDNQKAKPQSWAEEYALPTKTIVQYKSTVKKGLINKVFDKFTKPTAKPTPVARRTRSKRV